MNRSAVAHIPASQFAFARSEDTFTVRLRAAKGGPGFVHAFFMGTEPVPNHRSALHRKGCRSVIVMNYLISMK